MNEQPEVLSGPRKNGRGNRQIEGSGDLITEGMGSGRASLPAAWRWGLALLCLALYLPGLSGMPPLDRDEPRFAQASRQMLQSGDYVDIRFQDQARHKKPAGIYWLQSLSAAVSGAADSIWAYRLPSLAGMIGAVLMLAAFGARLFGVAAGGLAAGLLAVCVLAGVEARLATTDAVLLFCILAAQAVLARAYLEPPEIRRLPAAVALSFWVAVAAGVLIKGPVILACVGLTGLTLCVIDRRAAWLKRLYPATGGGLALFLAAPWYVLIGLQTEGAFFAEALGHDFAGKIVGGQESHGAPPGYYALVFWLVFWPGSLLAVPAARRAWRERMTPRIRFLLAWIIPYWLLLELVPTKLMHYLLPVLPAVALLSAYALVCGLPKAESRFGKVVAVVATGLWAIAGLAQAGGVPAAAFEFGPDRVALAVAAGVLALGVAGSAFYAVIHPAGRVRFGLAGVVCAAGFYGLTFGVVGPGLDGLWVSRSLADAFERGRACETPLPAAAGYREPSLVFLAGGDIRFTGGGGAAAHLLANPACALAAVESGRQDALREGLGDEAGRLIALETVNGLNYAKGKPVSLTVYRLAP